ENIRFPERSAPASRPYLKCRIRPCAARVLSLSRAPRYQVPSMPRGEVAEWLNAPHSKCGIRATVSGVRIPPSPPVLVDRAPRRDDQDHRRHEEGDARASAAGSEPATGGSGGPFL